MEELNRTGAEPSSHTCLYDFNKQNKQGHKHGPKLRCERWAYHTCRTKVFLDNGLEPKK